MSTSVSIRLSPGQVSALDALVRQEGGTVAGHIRTGLTFRLDLGEHRKAIRQICDEELKAAIEEQKKEWSSVRAQILEASLATDSNFRNLMASFLQKITEAPPPVAAEGSNAMPRRSSR